MKFNYDIKGNKISFYSDKPIENDKLNPSQY
jgi:hypothetical protein